MTIDPVVIAIALIAGGVGLIIGGAGCAVVQRPESRAMIAMAAAVLAIVMSGAASSHAALVVGAAIVIAGGLHWIATHSATRRLADALWRCVRSRTAQWIALGVLGCSLVALGARQIERSVAEIELQDSTHIDDMMSMPPIDQEPVRFVSTDRGTRIPLRHAADMRDPHHLREVEQQILAAQRLNSLVIRRKPAADVCNCHGWIFAAGQFWVHFDDVASILDDNGYRRIENPTPGDLVIYRTTGDEICHSAVVRAVCDDGSVLVEGKWGWMGVFLHRVGESCYGQNFEYYRSGRHGHLLAGMTPAPNRIESRGE